MSLWTHVIGVIYVDTFAEVDDIKAYVEEKLKDAPKITGAESDANVFINKPEGHNVSTNVDCQHCEYVSTLCYHDDYFECNAPENYQCPYGEYQTCAVITVQGDLRCRMKKQTKKEWNAFHQYIAKELKWEVRFATCRINGW